MGLRASWGRRGPCQACGGRSGVKHPPHPPLHPGRRHHQTAWGLACCVEQVLTRCVYGHTQSFIIFSNSAFWKSHCPGSFMASANLTYFAVENVQRIQPKDARDLWGGGTLRLALGGDEGS